MPRETIQLKVGANTTPAKFAGSVAKNLMEGKDVQARALGTVALNKMIRGIVTAQGFVDQNERGNSTPRKLLTKFEQESFATEGDDNLTVYTATFVLV